MAKKRKKKINGKFYTAIGGARNNYVLKTKRVKNYWKERGWKYFRIRKEIRSFGNYWVLYARKTK